jgi:hypothetical protein
MFTITNQNVVKILRELRDLETNNNAAALLTTIAWTGRVNPAEASRTVLLTTGRAYDSDTEFLLWLVSGINGTAKVVRPGTVEFTI